MIIYKDWAVPDLATLPSFFKFLFLRRKLNKLSWKIFLEIGGNTCADVDSRRKIYVNKSTKEINCTKIYHRNRMLMQSKTKLIRALGFLKQVLL